MNKTTVRKSFREREFSKSRVVPSLKIGIIVNLVIHTRFQVWH